MNKRNIKKIFIVVGTILLLLDFVICFIDTADIFGALITMTVETFVEFGELESVLSILGMVFLSLGLLIEKGDTSNSVVNTKKSLKKYRILRIIGYLPFVGILCFAIYSSIYGFSFFFSTIYGLSAFFGSILIFSLFFLWPLYIIGIIIIIKSSSKIKSFKNKEMRNATEKDRNID